MSRPVLAFGIEVAGADQVDALCAEGALPTIAGLRSRGAWAPLRSVTELSSGSVWPTLATGVNPGKHGQFFTHMQLRSGTYRIEKRYADAIPCDPLWLEVHRAGLKSVVVDVPQSRPAEGFRGAHVAGWGGEYPAWRQSSWPPELMGELLARHGAHPLVNQYRLSIAPRSEAEVDALLRKLLEGLRAKTAMCRDLVERFEPDLLYVVFPETHWAAHLLWQLVDPQHPDYDEQLAKRYEGLFRELFTAVDAALGELAALRPDAVHVAFSGSGMGGSYAAWHLLPEVLARLGLGPTAGAAGAAGAAKGLLRWLPIRRFGAGRVRGVEETLSLPVIETLKRVVPTRLWDRGTRLLLHAGSGWKDSRAFCVPNDYTGAIRLNLRGREPAGRVEPAEYDALCAEIAEAMLELEDVRTGRPIVREVVKTRERYHGEHVDELPDLVVVWTSDGPVDAVRSPRVGTVSGTFPERRTGGHRPWGFLAAAGPGIRAGARLPEVHTLDLPPTLLHLLGVPVPERYDGAVLHEILESGRGVVASAGHGAPLAPATRAASRPERRRTERRLDRAAGGRGADGPREGEG